MTQQELENIINKMYDLKYIREEMISQSEDNKIKIIDIVYVGKIKDKDIKDGNVIEKDIFMSIEEKDGEITYRYYDANNELLAIEQQGEFIPAKKNINKPEELNEIIALDKEGISLSENLEKNKKGNSQTQKKTKKDKEEKEQKVEIPLDQQIVSKVTWKEQTNLDEQAKGETLRKKLGLSEDYTKMILVDSDEVNAFVPSEKRIDGEDCFIAVKADGTGEVLGEGILEYDNQHTGKNSTRETTTINIDGSVNKEQNISRYRIKNRKNEYISSSWDENIGKEVKFSEWSDKEGEFLDTELETNKIYKQNYDVKMLKKEHSGVNNASNILDRSNKEGNCRKKDVTVVDNNKNNDSHSHEEELKNKDNEEIEEAIKKILQNETINMNYTEEEVRKYYEKIMNKRNMTNNEIENYIESDLERTSHIQGRNEI